MSNARGSDPLPIALVDLGDTLAECTPALDAELAAHEASVDRRSQVPFELHRRALLNAPGFWRRLAPRAAGLSLLGLLRDMGYQVTVLTKGSQAVPMVWADKVAWCREHLPGVPVIVTDDKSLVYGDVLVDDWLPYVHGWQQRWSGGLAIVPAQPWNAGMSADPLRLRDHAVDRAGIVAALQRRAQRLTPDRRAAGAPASSE